jgi:hypothetical protein
MRWSKQGALGADNAVGIAWVSDTDVQNVELSQAFPRLSEQEDTLVGGEHSSGKSAWRRRQPRREKVIGVRVHSVMPVVFSG